MDAFFATPLGTFLARELTREHRGVPLRLPQQEIEVLVHDLLALVVNHALRLEPNNFFNLDPKVHNLVADVPRRLALRVQ